MDEYRGYNGILVITPTGIIIKRGVRGVLLGGGMLRGDKTIPYGSIAAIQLKKAGFTAGYIQFTLTGGSDAKKGLFESTTDENTINFHLTGGNNKKFEEAKRIIEERMAGGTRGSSLSDLEKLAELRDKRIISNKEFENKKKQILGL